LMQNHLLRPRNCFGNDNFEAGHSRSLSAVVRALGLSRRKIIAGMEHSSLLANKPSHKRHAGCRDVSLAPARRKNENCDGAPPVPAHKRGSTFQQESAQGQKKLQHDSSASKSSCSDLQLGQEQICKSY
jgi:hypothetical protein